MYRRRQPDDQRANAGSDEIQCRLFGWHPGAACRVGIGDIGFLRCFPRRHGHCRKGDGQRALSCTECTAERLDGTLLPFDSRRRESLDDVSRAPTEQLAKAREGGVNNAICSRSRPAQDFQILDCPVTGLCAQGLK